MARHVDIAGYEGAGKWALNYGCDTTRATNLCNLGKNQLEIYTDGLDLFYYSYTLGLITTKELAKGYIEAELTKRNIRVKRVTVENLPNDATGTVLVKVDVFYNNGDNAKLN